MAHPPPIGEYTPQVPVQEGLRRVIPEERGISGGPALSELGGAVQRVAISEAANFTANALSQTQGQWIQHLKSAAEQAPPGAPGFTQAFMGDYGKYVDQTLKAAPNDIARKMLTQHLTAFGHELSMRSLDFESAAREQHSKDSGELLVQTTSSGLIDHPEMFEQRLLDNTSLINAMNLHPQDKDALLMKNKTELAHFATLGAISQDPYKAQIELTSPNPQHTYTAMLTPELREQLLAKADETIKTRLAASEQLDRITTKQSKEQADSIVKQGIQMSEVPGRLSLSWVNQQAPLLDHEQLDFLVKKATGKDEAVKSDPHTYADLMIRKSRGEDVTDEAKSALYAEHLSTADFSKLVEKNEQPDWFKRGTQYITTMSAYSEVNPNIESAQLKARMIDTWQDWASEHPKATMSEAQTAYQEIVRTAMTVKTAGLPPLRYRQGTDLQPDLAGTKAATVAAFERGEIDRPTFDREAVKIKEYENTRAASGAKATQ